MARVLVTGGAGFIGSHISEALVARGDQVRILDNFSSGNLGNLRSIENRIEIIEGDLRKEQDLLKAVQQVEIVFHEAAFVSLPESIEKPRECFEVNGTGVIALLEAARRASVKRVVLASSAAVYGASTDFPLREAGTIEYLSPYATSKSFNESLARLYTQTYQLPIVALRYFNVYGPRQSPTSMYAAVIPKFIEKLIAGAPPVIYGDGLQKRDFIFVTDVVRANLLAAASQDAIGRVFNVCSGAETSLLDLLEILRSMFPKGKPPKFEEKRLGDLPRSVGDPSLARDVLHFTATMPLGEGLKRCVEEWAA